LLIGNLSQSQEVTPLSPHSIMHWLLESAEEKAKDGTMNLYVVIDGEYVYLSKAIGK